MLPVAVLVALALLVVAVSWGSATGSPEAPPAEPSEPPTGDSTRHRGRAA